MNTLLSLDNTPTHPSPCLPSPPPTTAAIFLFYSFLSPTALSFAHGAIFDLITPLFRSKQTFRFRQSSLLTGLLLWKIAYLLLYIDGV